MRMRVGVVLLMVACSSKKPSSAGGSGSAGSGAPVADPCSASALGLGSATELKMWVPYCDHVPVPQPQILTSLQAVDAVTNCAAVGGGGEPPKYIGPIVVVTKSFSPAQVDLKVFDDGTTVTFVSVQRSPCPNDPRPMPSPGITRMYAPLVSEGTRTFADRACTVPTRCP